eukprot:PLAT10063.1.p2 GENE.PLAT10063.1~~PLAT10063.1.p2  ORF type:complete len:345 (+),score=126.49 PLAT10063.1:3-1037(+)
MAPKWRVYLRWTEGSEEDAMTLKLTLPKKWRLGVVSKLKSFFVDAYNDKNEPGLLLDDVHVENADGQPLADSDLVQDYIKNKEDVYIRPGPPPAERERPERVLAAIAAEQAAKEAAEAAEAAKKALEEERRGKLRCRNYGCHVWYTEEENSDDACLHHVSPPLFHETRKGWTCCPDRTAFDWEGFKSIEGCTVGRHSDVAPKDRFAESPTLAARRAGAGSGGGGAGAGDSADAAAAAPVVRSVEDFNAKNPDAPTAAASAAASIAAPKKSVRAADGTYRCVNKGCSKRFHPEDNEEGSCVYHVAGPVFHDRGKWWGCCPDSKAYEFDDFVKIAGCTVGKHAWNE